MNHPLREISFTEVLTWNCNSHTSRSPNTKNQNLKGGLGKPGSTGGDYRDSGFWLKIWKEWIRTNLCTSFLPGTPYRHMVHDTVSLLYCSMIPTTHPKSQHLGYNNIQHTTYRTYAKSVRQTPACMWHVTLISLVGPGKDEENNNIIRWWWSVTARRHDRETKKYCMYTQQRQRGASSGLLARSGFSRHQSVRSLPNPFQSKEDAVVPWR